MQATISLKKEGKAEQHSSLTKRVALGLFKTARAVAQHAHKVPDDIQSAWRETYRPKNV